MNITLLEPYYSGSHKAWARGYQRNSRHSVRVLDLPGSFWKWRMHGGAVTLAKAFLASDTEPDFLLASDMLDLTTFQALTRHRTASIPTALYFHENQLSYPWSPVDRDVLQGRDRHYGFINYVSAFAADGVFFNSRFHLDSFLEELHRLLQHYPDHRDLDNIDVIRAKSRVLPPGLDLRRFDSFLEDVSRMEGASAHPRPTLLWNHRWEFDKNPETFAEALSVMVRKGLNFDLILIGECPGSEPEAFTGLRDILGDRLLTFGYVDSFEAYARLVCRVDILPVTSNQDFFGISVVEAIYCNCFPLLPERLAYPELIPTASHADCFYRDFEDLVARLEALIRGGSYLPPAGLREQAMRYDWSTMADRYDEAFQEVRGLHTNPPECR